MPWVDLGEVVGKDGEIGNVNSTYINNGGDPGVNIVRSGDDGAPDFTFEFENLANDPLSESELEQIVAGQTVNSASVVNGTVLSKFMSALGSVFAAIDHKHDASDIDSGTLAAERIANDSIGTEKFKPAVRDSLSRSVKPDLWGDAGNRSVTMPLATDDNGDLYMLIASADGKLIYRRWHDGANTNVWAK